VANSLETIGWVSRGGVLVDGGIARSRSSGIQQRGILEGASENQKNQNENQKN
jgi:hypothetical protein